jgi:hypothetical protein
MVERVAEVEAGVNTVFTSVVIVGRGAIKTRSSHALLTVTDVRVDARMPIVRMQFGRQDYPTAQYVDADDARELAEFFNSLADALDNTSKGTK